MEQFLLQAFRPSFNTIWSLITKNKIMKKITFLVTLLLLFGCNTKKNDMIDEQKQNEKLIKTYFENFNNHDWEKMANMYVENAHFKDPTLGKTIVKQNRKQIIEKYSQLHKIFPDLNDKVINIYTSGENVVVVEFISSGTALDNSKFELPICTIFTLENGLIVKDFTYFDNFEE